MKPPAERVVQTLVLRNGTANTRGILLGKWAKGPLRGRYTGLLGPMHAQDASPEAAAARVCASLAPKFEITPSRLSLRAVFRFIELGEGPGSGTGVLGRSVEYEYVYCAPMHNAEGHGIAEQTRVVEACHMTPEWFDVREIPYTQMPADDEVWYPKVLHGDSCLTGEFTFRGKKLVSHAVEEVSREALELLELEEAVW